MLPGDRASFLPAGRRGVSNTTLLASVFLGGVLVAVVVGALLVTIGERKGEGRQPYDLLVPVDDQTTDPAVWGINWPSQYESYLRTTDWERTRYGGSDAIPVQKLNTYPWLRAMWSGYAFSIDYRESRGHAFTLHDQDHTQRVLQREQPGACLHCHAAVIPLYEYVGRGDIMAGFVEVSGMSWEEARFMMDDHGDPLVEHPVSCMDCHTPETMELRITRPAFKVGIAALKAHEGQANYDVNRDASRQEMRSFVCAQCHVEYYFDPDNNRAVTYPWSMGIRVEEQEAYYDAIGFSDWTHGATGGGMIKAQHPEFELWSQGTHAAAGVACADCHMPYQREGARKVSDHHVRSPMLNVNRSCQTCHSIAEGELMNRVAAIQDRTTALVDRSAAAVTDLITVLAAARALGADDEALAEAIQMQRSAQWRLDWIFSEGSRGFHAPQESARILGEAIDFARQGERMVVERYAGRLDRAAVDIMPPEGVTPDELAPTRTGPTVPGSPGPDRPGPDRPGPTVPNGN
ncbi:MAG: ammonia-forming cytochrome c nitrite reductase subunit c552 [Gemmatimonadales bacterium]|nr:MAG: ammonia-forming cytochrome c nitrite reductase subunit c552 [Gemmatimonadales bacterium]